MRKCLAGAAAGVVIALANLSAASASPAAAPMIEGGYALAPFSFVRFCIDYPDECPKSAGASRIRLTSARMAELVSVNRAVNAAIVPTPDASALRYWKLDVSAGDCNSFAVQKRHDLIARGWPAAALALTVVKTARGEGHLVVTVRTDQGDLVLDNLRSSVVAWQRAGYHWIMRQSERNPLYWVDLDGGRAGPAYAAETLDDPRDVAEAGDASGAVEAPAMAGRAFDAAMTEAAEAQAVQAALADLVGLIADACRAAPSVANEANAAPAADADLQAKLGRPIEPTPFGLL